MTRAQATEGTPRLAPRFSPAFPARLAELFALARDLAVPADWRLVAYLCLGWPEEAHDDPEFVRAGWERRHEPQILTR